METKLPTTQRSLVETQEIAHVGSWDFDLTTRRVTWSDEVYRIVGVDPARFVPSYESFLGRVHPDDRAAFEQSYAASVASRAMHDIDLRLVMDDGTIKYVHTRCRTDYADDGRPLRSVGTVLDITQRRQAEIALSESEKRHRDLVQSIADLIWEADVDGRLTYVSPDIQRLVGYRPEEVLGKDYSMLLQPTAVAPLAEAAKATVIVRKSICHAETTLRHRDGSPIEVDATIAPVLDGGQIIGYRGIVRDISGQKQTEQSLKMSELLLSNALALSRAAPWEYDVATNLFTFNDMFYAIFGTTAEEVGGYEMTPDAYAQRFVHPDDLAVVATEVQRTLETTDPEYSRYLQHRFVHACGEIGILGVKIRALKDEWGRTIKAYGVNQDITEQKRMEQEISLSKAIRASAVECSLEGVLIVDADMRIVYYNDVFAKMWGSPALMDRDDAELLRTSATRFPNPDVFIKRVRHLYENPGEMAHDKLSLNDGRIIERDSVSLYDDEGLYRGRAWFFRDVTERERAEKALRESEENFRAIFSSVREGIFVAEPDTGRFVEVNPSGCRMFGYSRDELIGADIGQISGGAPPFTLSEAIERHHGIARGITQFDWHCRRRDGELFWAAVSLQKGTFHGRELIFATLSDITERKKAEATILQMACYDSLTGLLNRRMFFEELIRTIDRSSRSGAGLAVLYLDLDHFKDINDILGHRVGDELLVEVSRRLQASMRKTDTVARFGGDEFAIIMSDLAAPEDAALLAQKLLKVLSETYLIGGNAISSGTSIGIAMYGPESPDAESIMTHADVALYRAKGEGRGAFQFFTEAMDAEVKARVLLTSELRNAASLGQLQLYYQPQVNLESGKIIGVEALLRWNHPSRGLIGAGEFIAAAERTGQIVELGRWVIGEACRQAGDWLRMGIAPRFVAINLSALQLKRPEDLERDIAAALHEHGLPAQMIELELTETALMDASRWHGDALMRLREMGIRIAIDDFGTGYSSLDYLRRFHVDRIKIAQDFVSDLERTRGDRVIVRAALGLARELGLGVVAEGIETNEQLLLLKSWGCREGQGYLFAAPMPAEAVTELLRKGCAFEFPGPAAHISTLPPDAQKAG